MFEFIIINTLCKYVEPECVSISKCGNVLVSVNVGMC